MPTKYVGRRLNVTPMSDAQVPLTDKVVEKVRSEVIKLVISKMGLWVRKLAVQKEFGWEIEFSINTANGGYHAIGNLRIANSTFSKLSEVREYIKERLGLMAISEAQVPLTKKVTNEFLEVITELVAKQLTIHKAAFKDEKDGWHVEFYANDLDGEYEVVGNLYITTTLFRKLQELMRISIVSKKEDLTEALVHDDEDIRDAADLRMYELALKDANLAEVYDNEDYIRRVAAAKERGDM